MKTKLLLLLFLFWGGSLTAQKDRRPISKVGYINEEGETVIKPQFDRASEFVGGFAAVEIDKKFHIINKKGKIVLSPDYDFVSLKRVNETFWGFRRGQKTHTWFQFNHKGKVLFKKECYFIWPSSSGIFGFENEQGYGYMNQKNKVVIAPEFQSGNIFSQGLARVKSNNLWGFIDTDANFVIPAIYDEVSDFKDGYAVGLKNGSTYIIDRFGTETAKINCSRIYLARFSEGAIALKEAGSSTYYYFQPDGSKLLEEGFYRCGIFINGIARILREGGETYYINKQGETISPIYLGGTPFQEGFAIVTTLDGTGIINEKFEFVLPDKYASCSFFREGLAAVYFYTD